MRLKREARVWNPIPLDTRIAARRFVVESVVMTVVSFGVVILALLLASCAIHVTVAHSLKSPIRCKMDHGKRDLGFVCAHEEPERTLQPHPGEGIAGL